MPRFSRWTVLTSNARSIQTTTQAFLLNQPTVQHLLQENRPGQQQNQHTIPVAAWHSGQWSSLHEQVNHVRPVSTWLDDRHRVGIPSWYVTSQTRQLSLASLQGRLIEYQLRLGRECHLCRVSGNTLWSHMACEFAQRCGRLDCELLY